MPDAPTLALRKIDHPTAKENYRVILKTDSDEYEIGSVGITQRAAHHDVWSWGVDSVMPPAGLTLEGYGQDRADCMRQFKEAWHKFSRNPERLEEFLTIKRSARRPWVK